MTKEFIIYLAIGFPFVVAFYCFKYRTQVGHLSIEDIFSFPILLIFWPTVIFFSIIFYENMFRAYLSGDEKKKSQAARLHNVMMKQMRRYL